MKQICTNPQKTRTTNKTKKNTKISKDKNGLNCITVHNSNFLSNVSLKCAPRDCRYT